MFAFCSVVAILSLDSNFSLPLYTFFVDRLPSQACFCKTSASASSWRFGFFLGPGERTDFNIQGFKRNYSSNSEPRWSKFLKDWHWVAVDSLGDSCLPLLDSSFAIKPAACLDSHCTKTSKIAYLQPGLFFFGNIFRNSSSASQLSSEKSSSSSSSFFSSDFSSVSPSFLVSFNWKGFELKDPQSHKKHKHPESKVDPTQSRVDKKYLKATWNLDVFRIPNMIPPCIHP